jgi:hypothetical protein
LETEDLIGQIRRVVQDCKHSGTTIDPARLDAWLAELAQGTSLTKEERQRSHELLLEHLRATQASNLAHYDAQNQATLESIRYVGTAGQGALKSATLINGGAAVAILGFLGNAWTKRVPAPILMGLPV